MNTSWRDFYLGMADYIGSRSKDPSSQVGAVIVDQDKRVISLGFNGPPSGVIDSPAISRETKLRRTVHAEANALLFAQRSVKEAILFCTHIPCSQCAALIVQSKLAEVMAYTPTLAFAERWQADIAETQALFQEAGIILTLVNKEE